MKTQEFQVSENPRLLPAVTVRRLSRLDPWVSAGAILREWALIAAAIWACASLDHPLVYIAAVVWIGARQHALSILMHDGSHFLLFKDKRVNDAVSELFLAWPIFITMRAYRSSHWEHHRYTNTGKDPDFVRKSGEDWMFPVTKRRLGMILLKDLLGLNTHELLRAVNDLSAADRVPRPYLAARSAFYALVLGLVLHFHVLGWFLALWVVPVLTWMKVALRIRSIAEHFCTEPVSTRTTLPTFLERWLIAPVNVGYHLDHHLYPSVPFFRLPELHEELRRLPEFIQSAHLTRTYLGVLKECALSR